MAEEAGADEAWPSIGQPLPGAEDPFIDPTKFVEYLLDPESERGRHKAEVFLRALDIERSDWEHLRDGIIAALPNHPVSACREPQREHEAYTWEVLVPIKGIGEKARRQLLVVTAWAMVDGRPHFVTGRVAPEKRQPQG
jgi:hypothetical protein